MHTSGGSAARTGDTTSTAAPDTVDDGALSTQPPAPLLTHSVPWSGDDILLVVVLVDPEAEQPEQQDDEDEDGEGDGHCLLELLLVGRRLAGIIAVVVHAPTAIVFVVGHRNE